MTINTKNTIDMNTKPLFSTHYHIYINHTDAGGIVYHANHLVFFENCRRDWFTKIGLSGYFLQTDSGDIQHFVVSQAQLQYRRAILLDEVIEVRIDKVELKPASIIFYQSIHRQLPVNSTLTNSDNLNTAESSADTAKSGAKSTTKSSTDTLLSSAKIVIACVQNQRNPAQSSDTTATIADVPSLGQSKAIAAHTAPIRPVRVPKSLYQAIKQAIDKQAVG